MRPTHVHPDDAGSAMLLTLLIIIILSALAFGIVTSGSFEQDASGAKRRHDKGLSCADAARDYLMSQFRSSGVNLSCAAGTGVACLTLNTQVDDQLMTTGHYDNLAVTTVAPQPGMGGGGLGVTDASNRIIKAGLGGQVYRMTVVCSSASGGLDAATRQSEVEFLVRFGI